MLKDKLIIAKVKMGSNLVNTCNKVTVLVLCTISDGHLSIYQVSFDFLLYFRDMHRTNLILQKLGRENNSINTDDRIMVLAF